MERSGRSVRKGRERGSEREGPIYSRQFLGFRHISSRAGKDSRHLIVSLSSSITAPSSRFHLSLVFSSHHLSSRTLFSTLRPVLGRHSCGCDSFSCEGNHKFTIESEEGTSTPLATAVELGAGLGRRAPYNASCAKRRAISSVNVDEARAVQVRPALSARLPVSGSLI